MKLKDKDLMPEVKQQLLNSLQRIKQGEKGISAEEVAKKLGLNLFIHKSYFDEQLKQL